MVVVVVVVVIVVVVVVMVLIKWRGCSGRQFISNRVKTLVFLQIFPPWFGAIWAFCLGIRRSGLETEHWLLTSATLRVSWAAPPSTCTCTAFRTTSLPVFSHPFAALCSRLSPHCTALHFLFSTRCRQSLRPLDLQCSAQTPHQQFGQRVYAVGV
jgi:hypothetical protein